MATPWFDPNMFGALYGSIAGGVGGTLGGLLGAAAGALAPKGKGRPWVMAGFGVMIALGFASLALGVVAIVAGQPYGIWYPPLLVGIILPVVLLGVLPGVRRTYDAAEARRIEAEGLRQG
jgi:peptidoglycan/LPS O-acetylase OafA/YrhL